MSDGFIPQEEELFEPIVEADRNLHTADIIDKYAEDATQLGRRFGDRLTDLISAMTLRAIKEDASMQDYSDADIEDTDAYMEITASLSSYVLKGMTEMWYYDFLE